MTTAMLDARILATKTHEFDVDDERHAGHAPDLSKMGDLFERMVAFVGRHIKVDR
jgi:hypothetical protein